MISKKGILKFVKYTLIFMNSFCFILSIFLGLFGIAYADKQFPLGYKGREMALCSVFCMLLTAIGYCGAQGHRRICLIVYGATNVIIVIILVILWILFKENSILGNKDINNMFVTTLVLTMSVMYTFSFILAFHISTFKTNTNDSIVSQSHQLLLQTTALLQQQQQQQQLHLNNDNNHHQSHHHRKNHLSHNNNHHQTGNNMSTTALHHQPSTAGSTLQRHLHQVPSGGMQQQHSNTVTATTSMMNNTGVVGGPDGLVVNNNPIHHQAQTHNHHQQQHQHHNHHQDNMNNHHQTQAMGPMGHLHAGPPPPPPPSTGSSLNDPPMGLAMHPYQTQQSMQHMQGLVQTHSAIMTESMVPIMQAHMGPDHLRLQGAGGGGAGQFQPMPPSVHHQILPPAPPPPPAPGEAPGLTPMPSIKQQHKVQLGSHSGRDSIHRARFPKSSTGQPQPQPPSQSQQQPNTSQSPMPPQQADIARTRTLDTGSQRAQKSPNNNNNNNNATSNNSGGGGGYYGSSSGGSQKQPHMGASMLHQTQSLRDPHQRQHSSRQQHIETTGSSSARLTPAGQPHSSAPQSCPVQYCTFQCDGKV